MIGASIAMGYGPGFAHQQGQKIFLFSTASILALGPTQSPFQGGVRASSSEIKWLRHEADHSSPSSAKVKNGEAILAFPHMSS
jgi:hypothetical protein